jgi:polyhydroxybutyrate depolymerase
MAIRRILPAILALALAALACRAAEQAAIPEETPTPTVDVSQDVPPGNYELNVANGEDSRRVIIHLPPDYDGETPMPMILVLHGGGGRASQIQRVSGMDAAADEFGFIVVYPDGSGPLEEALFTWNTGHCCGYALEQGVDDVAFLTVLLNSMQGHFAIDPDAVFVTGISNGAMMAYRAAADLSDRIAGIAPIAGTIGGSPPDSDVSYVIPQPDQPVAVIAFHGQQDQNVLYGGGEGPESIEPGRFDMSVADSMAFWVAANGCSGESELETLADDNVLVERYLGCTAPVVLVTIVDGGHAWPGGGRGLLGEPPTQDISASEMMLEFFLALGN